MSLFSKLVFKSFAQLFVLMTFSLGLIIVFYFIFRSILICVVLALLLFLGYIAISRSRKGKQSELLNELESLDILRLNGKSIFELKDKLKWHKGYALLKSRTYVSWLHVTEKELLLYFLGDYNHRCFSISWEQIVSLEYCFTCIEGTDIQLVKVHLAEYEEDIYLPWVKSLDILVPQNVSIQK